MTANYAHLWDLDPATTYLNHGSFGPSPISVRAARESWSTRLERQPMRFFCQDMEEQLEQAAQKLANFLQTKATRLVLIDNATLAMNIVAESIPLQPGDEVLLTDHEYGAVRNIWNQRCQQTGARIVNVTLPFPLNDADTIQQIQNAFSERSKVLVISHVTSATAAILPVKEICSAARQHGVLTAIDGPHAIAMLDVAPDDYGCDFYCASCHKWLCAAFGSGFLYVHPKHQNQIRCPIVSWGGSIAGHAPSWKDSVNWLGTRDPAALLSIPAAIDFMKDVGLKTFRQHAHQLIASTRQRLLDLDGIGPLCTAAESDVVSMCAVELPQPAGWKPGYHGHPDPLQLELRDQFGIEVPVAAWNGHRFLRFSAHLYNTAADFDKLIDAVSKSPNLR